MSETEEFLKESGEALQPIAGEMLRAAVGSLNTLCGGAVSCGEHSVVAGGKDSAPAGLSAPLVAGIGEVTGDVSGSFALVVDVPTARALAALMLGGEPPAGEAEALEPDESDAFKELGSNAASSIGAALRSTLSCEASVSLKSIESLKDLEKLPDFLGGEMVFVSAEGKVGERQTTILLACGSEMCRAAVKAAAPAEEPAETVAQEELPPNVKRILKIPVPLIVVLAEKSLMFKGILEMTEGTVMEFEKKSAEPLSLLVNDRKIALGRVVKVGERFGLRLEEIGDPEEIVRNLQ